MNAVPTAVVPRTDAAPSPADAGTVRGLWWLAPAGGVVLIVPLTLLLASRMDAATYHSAWRTEKALEASTVLTLAVGALVLMIGGILPQFAAKRSVTFTWPGLTDSQYAMLRRVSGWVFWLTMFGYGAMAAIGMHRGVTPGAVAGAIISQDTFSGSLKTAFAPVAGVTTFTQLGIAYVVVATLLLLRRPDVSVGARLAIVVGLAAFRAYLVSERLALLELLVPIAVVVAMAFAADSRRRVRLGAALAPIVLLPASIVLFGLFEYSRSWVWYSANRSNGTFLGFAVERWAGYYVTAYNNGQLALTYETASTRVPLRTIDGFWTAPVIEQMNLYQNLSPASNPSFQELIAAHGNPEFNNTCGLCDPFVDYGTGGGLIFLLAAGVILGICYRKFADGGAVAVLVYPALFTGILELPRYLYWTSGRFLPGLATLIIAGLIVGRSRADPRNTVQPPIRAGVEP